MSFRCANAANIKYNDTSYDEKRVWVSRLLAQFLMADVVIISIDESSFKQEGLPRRFWQASSKTTRELLRYGSLDPRIIGLTQGSSLDENTEVKDSRS